MQDFTTGVASFEVPNPNGEPVLGRITVFNSGTMVLAQEAFDGGEVQTILLNQQAVEAVLYMLHTSPNTYQITTPKYPVLRNPVLPVYKRIAQALTNIYKRLGVV